MSEHPIRICCLENVTALRALLDCLAHRFGLHNLHMTLLYDWVYWIIRVRHTRILDDSPGDLDALLQEYGHLFEVDKKLATVFVHLDGGTDLIRVMQEDHMPIIAYGEIDFESVEVFCKELTQGLGYCPPSLS